jgi:flagellar hook assembly protein FlgD
VESDPLGIDEPGVPTPCFTLQGNYPNPFNPETTIRFSLPGSAAAKLEIFNIKGQKVRTLLDSVMAAGQHSLVWNGLDDAKNPVGNGVYFYRLSSGGKSKTRKMIMLK